MKLSKKEIKIIIGSLQFENFSDTKKEDRVKLLDRFRKKLKSDLLHPVSKSFDDFEEPNILND
tara:strand:+ start:135 stop:323 length:189 start_codon:yes stop_codon:yes gene_type:complete